MTRLTRALRLVAAILAAVDVGMRLSRTIREQASDAIDDARGDDQPDERDDAATTLAFPLPPVDVGALRDVLRDAARSMSETVEKYRQQVADRAAQADEKDGNG